MQCVFHFSVIVIGIFALAGSTDVKQGWGDQLFELLLELRRENGGGLNATTTSISVAFQRPIHLLRVPKASSSSLSILARRMVGCEPPGPCCKWPGDPPGSCPAKGLFACQTEGKVIGCTHHYPNFDALKNNATASFSMIREPYRRSISAFFYPGIHHNSKCTGSVDACFLEYTSSTRWRNVVVKMLTGSYAYSTDTTCARVSQCKNSLEAAIRNLDFLTFMGVAELWELSLVVLHLNVPRLVPVVSEFRIAEQTSSSSQPVQPPSQSNNSVVGKNNPGVTTDAGKRANHGLSYQAFRDQAMSTGKYLRQLESQNALDTALYVRVVERLCLEVQRTGLWKHQLVRDYWQAKSPMRLTAGGNSSSCDQPRP